MPSQHFLSLHRGGGGQGRGSEAAELRYVSRGDRSGERIVVTIGKSAPGTRIEVKAECNRSGDMTGVLAVE